MLYYAQRLTLLSHSLVLLSVSSMSSVTSLSRRCSRRSSLYFLCRKLSGWPARCGAGRRGGSGPFAEPTARRTYDRTLLCARISHVCLLRVASVCRRCVALSVVLLSVLFCPPSSLYDFFVGLFFRFAAGLTRRLSPDVRVVSPARFLSLSDILRAQSPAHYTSRVAVARPPPLVASLPVVVRRCVVSFRSFRSRSFSPFTPVLVCTLSFCIHSKPCVCLFRCVCIYSPDSSLPGTRQSSPNAPYKCRMRFAENGSAQRSAQAFSAPLNALLRAAFDATLAFPRASLRLFDVVCYFSVSSLLAAQFIVFSLQKAVRLAGPMWCRPAWRKRTIRRTHRTTHVRPYVALCAD